jgi:hypothetical protein
MTFGRRTAEDGQTDIRAAVGRPWIPETRSPSSALTSVCLTSEVRRPPAEAPARA